VSDIDDLLDNAISRQDEAALELARALVEKKEAQEFVAWLKATGKSVGETALKEALPLVLALVRGAVARG
jgi:predicted negative regulator of RcsB-dependent stress response